MRTTITRPLTQLILLATLTVGLTACAGETSVSANGDVDVRLGYFPNVTHAVALVGLARGTFQADLGKRAHLQTTTFNAGPALIEALLANAIDIGYVGPSPAVNGYVQSHGQALRIIAGAASGGAEFIVRPGAHITSPGDLSGKKIATPQLGNTQDIALRYYLESIGLKTTDKGGTVQVLPTNSNAEILTLFKQGQIDGAWVPEPYASRLVVEDGGQVFLDERTLWPGGSFATTTVVVRTQFLRDHPDVVRNFLKAHIETVQYINAHQSTAESVVNAQIKSLTSSALKPGVLARSFTSLTITYDPLAQSVLTTSDHALALGFLGTNKLDLSGIYDLTPLNQELKAKGLAPVSGL